MHRTIARPMKNPRWCFIPFLRRFPRKPINVLKSIACPHHWLLSVKVAVPVFVGSGSNLIV
ncbi:hypothetical protein DO71_6019 [Burkholderia pseudomallei]|nr:hypothetical protein DO71_6019 [Burkholderia pseudomallei]